MSKKLKLCIASSNRAKVIAHEIEASLVHKGIDAYILDIDTNSFHIGEETLNKLLAAGRANDFAVVILTKDDIVVNPTKETNYHLLNVPRDNCIFELGFFIGSLNLEPQRCFFVTSLNEDALPADFKGYLYCRVDEPADWNALNVSEKDIVGSVSAHIAERVASLSSFKEDIKFSVISNAKLIELENISNKNLIEESQILVQAFEPIETNLVFARRVFCNMENNVTYNYLFPAHENANAGVNIVNMIQAIAIASFYAEPDNWDLLELDDRLKTMEKYSETIEQNLELIKYQLFIHFVPHRLSEEFCIHNANSEQDIKGYLRWLRKDYFLELERDQTLIKYKAYESFMHSSYSTIFGSTPFIPLDQVVLAFKLPSLIKTMFPKILINKVNQVFFGW